MSSLKMPKIGAENPLSLAVHRLEALDPHKIEKQGEWSPARTFLHMSQSIHFSMSGFPSLRPALIRYSVGKLAFHLFDLGGRMRHDLSEPIPGESVAAVEPSTKDALNELFATLEAFQRFDGQLQPHFTYGLLDKDAYARAHSMHVNNHLDEFLF